jgi:predicted acetyltransferase
VEVREVAPADRAWVESVLVGRWGSTRIMSRGHSVDAAELPGLLAEADGERVGLVTFQESAGRIEVVTLDALRRSVGVGTALLAGVRQLAERRRCSRIWLVTTNDNLAALRFYQRRGFRLVAVHVGAVDRERALKPGIPLVGLEGVEIHDEIELACALPAGAAAAPSAGAREDAGEVVLEKVAERDKAVLARLLQLYRYDLSAIRHLELDAGGTFVFRFLDLYFLGPDREAWFIRHDGQLSGFAMTRTLPDGASEVAEFFVVRAHRRAGVGRRAAAALLGRHPGRWEVTCDLANVGASRFWPEVVGAAATGPVEHRREGPPERAYDQFVLRFSTG